MAVFHKTLHKPALLRGSKTFQNLLDLSLFSKLPTPAQKKTIPAYLLEKEKLLVW